MSSVNDPIVPAPPVIVDFWWNATGPNLVYTVAGDTYPYVHQADGITRTSDSRYAVVTTITNINISFDAIGAASPNNPKVIMPAGSTVIEYIWNFGDNTVGFGPQPSHTYKVSSPSAQATLTVVDQRNRTYTVSKALNLVYGQIISVVPFKTRR